MQTLRRCWTSAGGRSHFELLSPPGPSQAQDSEPVRNLFGNDDPHPAGATIVELPEDFVDRAERLTSQTILWPPKQYRYVMCGWTADHIAAMNKGDATAAILQKTIHKLLLAHVPRRCSTSNELSLRLKYLRKGTCSDFFFASRNRLKLCPGYCVRLRKMRKTN